MAPEQQEGRRRIFVDPRPRVIDPESRPPTTPGLGAWWVVVALGAVGLVVLALDQLRAAVVCFAVTLFAAALLRLLLSQERAGGLVVRTRFFDVLVLVVLGAAILVVGLALRRT